MDKPYKEEHLSNFYLRTFSKNTLEEDLKWHWDEEDRLICSSVDTDWLFQFDNKLPQSMNSEILIEKGRFHRIIKGKGDLIIKITKIF